MKHSDSFGVQDTHPPAADGSHGQFFLSRNPEFTNHENIQRRMKRSCNFKTDRYAASRQSEHDGIVSVGELLETRGQTLTGIDSVSKYHAAFPRRAIPTYAPVFPGSGLKTPEQTQTTILLFDYENRVEGCFVRVGQHSSFLAVCVVSVFDLIGIHPLDDPQPIYIEPRGGTLWKMVIALITAFLRAKMGMLRRVSPGVP